MSASFLSKQEMEKLTTKRLLAYKRKILKRVHHKWYTTNIEELEEEFELAKTNLKLVLDTREHIENE